MIAKADTQRVFFLSLALRNGSMEAFDNIDDAVAHATALVEGNDTERAIFVAVPRAHVRMAVRFDAVDPLPMEVPEQTDAVHEPSAWERDRALLGNTVSGDSIDPIVPPPMPELEQRDIVQGTSASERAQDPVSFVNGDVSAIEKHAVADEYNDDRTTVLLEAALVSLEAKLRHAQVDYRRACARGDDERISQARLRISAITAEQNRLILRLSRRPATA